MAEGRGGRTRKKEEHQVNKTVKTTLTGKDFDWLETEYKRETTGQKVSFAEFIRQRILSTKRVGERANQRAEALTIQMTLSEIRDEIQILASYKTDTVEYSSGEEGEQKHSQHERESATAASQLLAISQQLTETIKGISIWLYGSSPEKI
ncbi:hypothetical protein [Spirosoma sordidisoli]|uniref:Uncharacterized protein n=1 Tax=Spirosoma sordidisoli TaxID=2502893 RepID=A0A4Q2UID0_9BACT|nr:hypothetical protein [Spirosoma sordidisoli]RYC66509.1 hypothetical protein EQG79_29500 [Spirosoma sordidisoli]